MKRNAMRIAAGLLAVAAMTGCAGTSKNARLAPQPQTTPAEAPLPDPVLEGKVLETMNVDSYTYLLIEKDGRSTWSAIPFADVKTGEQIALVPGIDIVNFKSAILGRTFPYIHFSAGIKGGKPYVIPQQKDTPAGQTAAMPSNHPALTQAAGDAKAPGAVPANHPPMGQPAPNAKPAYQPVLSGKVVESLDSNGYTYVCLEKDGRKTWAAIPVTKLKKGAEVSIYPGNIMPVFTSKSLKRTFENIVFSRGLVLDEDQ
ncbi:hypothetical protein [Geomonas edaphica]|uniref:hypothetical protein n=1 Tax=Geomonas edaphica TaxID=2570226 RepID=UPI0010A84F50|nr:hypothetical protein [Geomonas edaphica]